MVVWNASKRPCQSTRAPGSDTAPSFSDSPQNRNIELDMIVNAGR
jgi:hypothetical protein